MSMLRRCCDSLVADYIMTCFFVKKIGIEILLGITCFFVKKIGIGILLGDGDQKNPIPRIGRALGGGDHKIPVPGIGRALGGGDRKSLSPSIRTALGGGDPQNPGVMSFSISTRMQLYWRVGSGREILRALPRRAILWTVHHLWKSKVYGEFSNRNRFERGRELVAVVSVKGLSGDCLSYEGARVNEGAREFSNLVARARKERDEKE
ncbi:hypothetical protein AMTR_s00042p00225410 [Amborella trichopoda]|uniref:Uncharacterized protein n=1 Tax=Amborella trichopoda TaxID=13333 RepID=W1P7G9_AMBTC|nr:hypothetical protein AMTR_s00042p00225410 [Amborella trichopoda]